MLAFGSILLLSILVSKLFSFSFDATPLIIALMIAVAWFLGRNPGLLIAFIFEATLVYFQSAPYTTKSAVITFNRLALFVSLVLFASSRRKAEEKLREQHELLKVTLKSIGDAVIATDADGKISFINPTAEQLTGWLSEDACLKPIDEVFRIVNEETHETVESPFSAVMRKGATVGLANHTVLLSKTGAEIPIEDSGAPIKDTSGKIIGVIIVFHDVTERRRIEKEREQLLKREQAARSEAEAAGLLKDEFLATVSHELRTPLNAILGWSAMLRKEKMEETNVRNALGIIERNARAQAEIVGDILDVSRIITGKLRLQTHPLNLAPVVRTAVENISPAALAKTITIKLSLDEDAGQIVGDADRIQQIIWNLLSNAIKFTSSGGTIEIGLRRADTNVELQVRDNGIGIENHFLPFIFERFRQFDSSTTRKHSGLGLGLSIVRHLVELHGGTVSAESNGDLPGATFTVLLPLANETEQKILHSASDSTDKIEESAFSSNGGNTVSGLDNLRLLVVDDDADTLEIIKFILENAGAETKIAASAAEAFDIFQNWKPDVLISDLGMPDEDGYSLLRRIRALRAAEGGTIPAAALSAYTRNEDRDKALDAGFQTHIAKPVDPEQFVSLIAELAERQRNDKNNPLFS